MKRLKKETLRLGLLNIIISAGGFVFHILLGRSFGASWELDCLFVGLTFFGLTSLSNNYLTSLLVPVFNEIKKDDENDSILFIDVVLKWTVIISIVIIGLVYVFDKLIVVIIATGFDSQSAALEVRIIRVLVLTLLFTNISQTLTLTLNALHFYSIPASIRLLKPLINILSLFLLVPRFGVLGIAIGDVIAGCIRALILVIFFKIKTGWSPGKYLFHRKLPELINLSSRMSLNEVIWNLRGVIIRNIASQLGEGAITLYSYAEKLIRIMIQISIGSIVKVYYSRISQWISLDKLDNVKRLFARASRANMALSLFFTSLSAVFLPALLRLLFLNSKFSSHEIVVLSMLFNILLIYYLLTTFRSYLTRIIFALKKVWAVTLIAVTGIAVLSIAVYLLSLKYGIYGLTYGVIVSELSICILYYFFTKKTLGLHILAIAKSYYVNILLAFVFVAVGFGLRRVVISDLVFLSTIMPAWCLGYALLARIVLKSEIQLILSK